ncbi:unnamed protein product [Closterium sp. NIES-53]
MLHRYGFGQLTQAIATWLHTTQLQHLLTSPYIGITCDKSTDRCRGKHIIVFATFIRENRVVTEFLALLTVEKCDAASLLYVFVSHLQALGIELAKIADVLKQLNILNKSFQQREIRRTMSHLETRYVDCGDDFGGGLSARLSPFILKYGLDSDKPEVTVQGVDSDGRPTTHKFQLHENPSEDYPTLGTHDACVDLSTAFAETLVKNLSKKFEDLDNLVEVRLFMPDEYPPGRAERHKQCVEWLMSLVSLIRTQETDHILPGIDKLRAMKELRAFCPILAGAPNNEQSFYAGLTAMLKTSDWTTSYPNLMRLWVAVAVLPLSTVECERGFSRQNIIKSWQRGSLKDSRLEDLVTMSLLDYEPDYEVLVKIWRSYKKRRPFGNVAAPPAREGEGSGRGKEALEEWEEPKAQGSDDESDSDADTCMTPIE